VTAHSRSYIAPSKHRPRLLLVIPDIRGGGAERVVANLLGAMQPDLFEYHLATLKHREDNCAEFPLPDHVTRHVLRAKSVETALLPLTLLVWKLRPDVICSHIAGMNVVTAIALALSRIEARLVLVEHHIASSALVSSGPAHVLLQPAMRLTYPLSDRVVGVSSSVLAESLRLVGALHDRGVVLPNPVVGPDIERLSAPAAGHHWLDDSRFEVVLGIGRLVEPKNFTLLIDAFAIVATRRPAARLIIMGTGPLRQVLQAHIERRRLQPFADLVGHLNNPFPSMRRAGVVAVTSHSEGLSTVIIEALALGTTVVATDFASARDALPSWGPAPVAHTSLAVAAAIEWSLVHPEPRERLKRWAAQFGVGIIARRYEQLFLEVLNDKASKAPSTATASLHI
jgi:glycosyltransferase involved in cell wall biosynthesis